MLRDVLDARSGLANRRLRTGNPIITWDTLECDRHKKLGAKEISTAQEGGAGTMREDASNRQALTDEGILHLQHSWAGQKNRFPQISNGHLQIRTILAIARHPSLIHCRKII